MKKQNKNIKMVDLLMKHWRLRIWYSLVIFFHVICKISNFSMWNEEHLAQASCTELTSSKRSLYFLLTIYFQICRWNGPKRPAPVSEKKDWFLSTPLMHYSCSSLPLRSRAVGAGEDRGWYPPPIPSSDLGRSRSKTFFSKRPFYLPPWIFRPSYNPAKLRREA